MVKLGVDASAQGKGIGRKLAVKCIEKAKELKATKLELESHSSLKVYYIYSLDFKILIVVLGCHKNL